jgi:hypothetical protein
MISEALKDTIKRLEDHKKTGETHDENLRKQILRIRHTTTRIGSQMTVKAKVGKETIKTIIDSGADINYVNKKWYDKMKIPYKMTGWGWIKSYKGEKSRTNILEANIKMKVQGRFCRSRFTVLEETGEDLLVLGDPWLTEQNPDIDWQKRTLRFRAKPSIKEGTRAPYLRVVDSRTFQHMEAPWREYNETTGRNLKEKKGVRILSEGMTHSLSTFMYRTRCEWR